MRAVGQWGVVWVALAIGVGCGTTPTTEPEATKTPTDGLCNGQPCRAANDAGLADAGAVEDSGAVADAGAGADTDAGVEEDAGAGDDAGAETDAGVTCGGTDSDNDGVCTPRDCDDTRAHTAPGLPEVCDGLDNNCNSIADEGKAGAAFTPNYPATTFPVATGDSNTSQPQQRATFNRLYVTGGTNVTTANMDGTGAQSHGSNTKLYEFLLPPLWFGGVYFPVLVGAENAVIMFDDHAAGGTVTESWRITVGGKVKRAPLIDNNVLYYATDTGEVGSYEVTASARTKRWAVQLGGEIDGSPIRFTMQCIGPGGNLSKTVVAVASSNGNLYFLDPNNGSELLKYAAGASGAGIRFDPINQGFRVTVPTTTGIAGLTIVYNVDPDARQCKFRVGLTYAWPTTSKVTSRVNCPDTATCVAGTDDGALVGFHPLVYGALSWTRALAAGAVRAEPLDWDTSQGRRYAVATEGGKVAVVDGQGVVVWSDAPGGNGGGKPARLRYESPLAQQTVKLFVGAGGSLRAYCTD
ncbi:MAG: PQQ-binding-like beta-propeller repeat protein [Deltaproteobacteria bacterium]|nr:PQQ-binding-like beta-propeller repeat protein [Deltaproteobacteria bacterium]